MPVQPRQQFRPDDFGILQQSIEPENCKFDIFNKFFPF